MARKPLLVGLLSLVVAAAAYLLQAPERDAATAGGGATALEVATPSRVEKGREPEPSWGDADWAVFAQKVRWALDAHLDTLPMGKTVAAVGRTFVGTAYVPRTLEADGPEHLVVDFRALDCVTFVETALALSSFVHQPDADALLAKRGAAEDRFEALLTDLRYRGGVLDGYPSRLHYFSDWIADAEVKGLVTDLTGELGGVSDREPLDFMTTHPDAYRQLSDPVVLEAMGAVERRLTGVGRRYVPEDRVAQAASDIRDGDIIAATSTVKGLDVAHTGLALRVDGTLRLLHAPLVGDSVQVSEEPLAQRIRRIPTQDGIMVARPSEVRAVDAGSAHADRAHAGSADADRAGGR